MSSADGQTWNINDIPGQTEPYGPDVSQKLQDIQRKSQMELGRNPTRQKSAYTIEEEKDHGFCGQTISYYNPILRWFFNISCVILITTFTATISAFCFQNSLIGNQLSGLNDMVYWNVMMISARLGYITDGVEERNLIKCRQKYQSSIWFAIDLFTVFPLFLFTGMIPNISDRFIPKLWAPIGKIVKMPLPMMLQQQLNSYYRQKSLLRLIWVLRYLTFREEEPGSSTLVFRSFKSLLMVYFTWFGLSALWYRVACSPSEVGGFQATDCWTGSWMTQEYSAMGAISQLVKGATNDTTVASDVDFVENRILNSMYWAMATASSTGIGDFRAYTVGEKVFSVLSMFVGAWIMYGMTIGGFTAVLTNFDARRSTFIQKYQAFKEEVNRLHVSTYIKEMCLNYYDYMWHKYDGQNVHTTGFLDILPDNLRGRFYEACFRPLTDNADLFKQLEPAFTRNLALASEPVVYLEDQFIEKQKEIGNHMTFLKAGMLEILDEKEEEAIAYLNPGKLFGQILLVFDLPRVNSIRCKTNCEVFILNKHNFREVLSEYPESAKLFIEAAREKCIGGRSFEWPIPPPDKDHFTKYITSSFDKKRRASKLNSKEFVSKVQAKVEMQLQSRNKRHSLVDTAQEDEKTLQEKMDFKDSELSLVNFLVFGKSQKRHSLAAVASARRNTVKIDDGTELVTNNANIEDLKGAEIVDPAKAAKKQNSMLNTFLSKTLIHPDSMYLTLWQDYMFLLSLFSAVYTSWMAFFCTIPGKSANLPITNPSESASTFLANNLKYYSHLKSSEYSCSSYDTMQNLIDCSKVAEHYIKPAGCVSDCSIYVPAWYDTTHSPMSGGMHIFLSYILIDLSYYLNIFVNLRTGIKTPNGYYSEFKDIFKIYNKWNHLYLDILAIFPFEIFSFFASTPLAVQHAWVFLRLTRLLYFFRHVPAGFSRHEYSLDVNISRLRAFKVIVYLFFVTHVFSCAFYFLACSYAMQSHLHEIDAKCRVGSWGWTLGLDWESSDYLMTIYWATTTMSSTGYGDITSFRAGGRIVAMFVMLFGTFMYGWIIAVIASTVSNNEQAEVSYENKLHDTKTYMDIHKVPKPLVERVMDVRYIEWERYHGTAVPGEEFIGSELGDNFRSSLLYETVHKFLQDLPFFKGIDESFIHAVCEYAHTYHYNEGDIIIYTGDLSRNLCVVRRGHCDVVTEDLSTIVEHLKPGDYFGDIEVLFGCGSPRTVVADTCCEIIVLSREDINMALTSFPLLTHHFDLIEKNEEYKNGIINLIKERSQEALRKRFTEKDMTKRYNVANVVEDVCIYSSKATKVPFTQRDSGSFCFNSESEMYIYYEMYRVVAIVATLMLVPLLFSIQVHSGTLWAFQYILDVLAMLDQIVKGYTGFYNRMGIYISDTKATWRRYIREGSFVVDLISWFPWEIIPMFICCPGATEQQLRFIGLFRILRLLQFYKVDGYISYWLHNIRSKKRWAFHVQSLFIALLLHHWVACILFTVCAPPSVAGFSANATGYIALTDGIQDSVILENSWLGQIHADTSSFPSLNLTTSLWDQYIISFYWGSATLTAVGFGDISATNNAEMTVATFVMLAGTVFYSYVIGEISSNIQMTDMRRGQFHGRLSDILQFFKVYDISKALQEQVLKHYYYLWNRTKGVSPNELLTGLPPTIRTTVCQTMYNDMIMEAFDVNMEEVKQDKDTLGFFRLVATHIKPRLFLEGSLIVRKDDAGEEMFFIQRGHVGLMAEDDTIIKSLGPGQHFGEVALLHNCTRSHTIKALTNCDITVLTRQDLNDVLEKFPQFSDQLKRTAADRKMHGTKSLTYTYTPSEAALSRGFTIDTQGKKAEDSNKKGLLGFLKIDRDSFFTATWNQLTILMGFFTACLSLIQLCFHSHGRNLYGFALFLDIWFLFDMVISFHTSYMDRFKTNVFCLPRIHRHYFRNRGFFMIPAFALDALANFPFEVIAFAFDEMDSMIVFAGLRLNRIIRLHRVVSIFDSWENDIRRNALVARMYKFVLGLFFTINSFSCFFYAMACPRSVCGVFSWTNAGNSDYAARGITGDNGLPWLDGVYWASAVITTTGYGDITPKTQSEMFYACIAMIVGKMMVGYVLGMIGATQANDEALRVWYEGNVDIVKAAMKDLHFGSELQEHIVQYYNYMWLKNHGTNVMKLFPDLAFSLRADIYSEICGDLVKGVDLFKGCPDNFIRHLCTVLTPVSFMPGDYITVQGDIRTEMYLIKRGVAEIVHQGPGGYEVNHGVIAEGETFLPQSVLCKVKRNESLRCGATTYVDVFVLTMDNLQEVLQYYPDVRKIILENGARLYPQLDL